MVNVLVDKGWGMMPFRKAMVLQVLCLCLFSLGVAAAEGNPETPLSSGEAKQKEIVERGAFEISPPEGKSISKLHVTNSLGGVKIVGHDLPTLVVKATKRAPNQNAIERLSVSIVPDSNGVIRVSTSLKEKGETFELLKDDAWVDLDVYVPRSANVNAKTWSGNLRIQNVDNGSRARSNRGNINLHQIMGLVDLKSRRGHHSVSEAIGTVHATVLHGGMLFDDIAGELLDARMHVGDMELKNIRSTHVMVKSTDGKINVSKTWAPNARYEISTLHGSVTWRGTGRKIKATLKGPKARFNSPKELKSSKGSPVGTRYVNLGGGKTPAHLELKSLDGAITVTEF